MRCMKICSASWISNSYRMMKIMNSTFNEGIAYSIQNKLWTLLGDHVHVNIVNNSADNEITTIQLIMVAYLLSVDDTSHEL